jgi:zinc protease
VPKVNPDEIAIETLQIILGGSFTSRLNMNLREGKHWSYGAFAFIWSAQAQRPFIAYAPVQADKTKDSMIEMDKELRGILGPRPLTEEELVTAQKNQTLTLPGSWETLDAVQTSIGEIVRYGLPDDYFITYPEKVRALRLPDLNRAAEKMVLPHHLVWVVVGDRAKVEPAIRELGWGAVTLLDADGNPNR